jgi:hypothetical protein
MYLFYFQSLQASKDVFVDLIPLCKKTNEIINEVFINNERIMEQFVKDLFLGRVQVILYSTTFLFFYYLFSTILNFIRILLIQTSKNIRIMIWKNILTLYIYITTSILF